MSGYKPKTNKACKKRFRKTASGMFLSKQCGIKHINTKMRRKVQRKLSRSKVVGDAYTARLSRLLPYE